VVEAVAVAVECRALPLGWGEVSGRARGPVKMRVQGLDLDLVGSGAAVLRKRWLQAERRGMLSVTRRL
jgi:hypothetical protein